VQQIVKDAVDAVKANQSDVDYETTLIADLFNSGTDEETIASGQMETIQPYIEEINNANTVEDAFRIVERQRAKGLTFAFLTLSSAPDLEDSTNVIAQIRSGGYNLDPYHYLDTRVVDAYLDATRNLLMLGLGIEEDQAQLMAKAAVDFESELAAIAAESETAQQSAEQMNNRYQYSDLAVEFPGVPWNVISDEIGLPENIGAVMVDCPSCFTRLSELVRDTPLEDLKAYMLSCFLKSATPYLGNEFLDIEFEFAKV
jgi:putative endopeptidase